jgi:hypothetical protein
MAPPKPRGRPPVDDDGRNPSVNVHLRLSADQYDATYARARAARVTLSQWIRRTVRDANQAKLKS